MASQVTGREVHVYEGDSESGYQQVLWLSGNIDTLPNAEKSDFDGPPLYLLRREDGSFDLLEFEAVEPQPQADRPSSPSLHSTNDDEVTGFPIPPSPLRFDMGRLSPFNKSDEGTPSLEAERTDTLGADETTGDAEVIDDTLPESGTTEEGIDTTLETGDVEVVVETVGSEDADETAGAGGIDEAKEAEDFDEAKEAEDYVEDEAEDILMPLPGTGGGDGGSDGSGDGSLSTVSPVQEALAVVNPVQ